MPRIHVALLVEYPNDQMPGA